MRDNKGFTLIELILVITIAAILAGGSLMSLKYLSYANVNKVTEKIDSSLTKLQMDTISKAYPYGYLAIEWDNTEQVYYLTMATSTNELTQANWSSAAKTIVSRKKIADKKITITYVDLGEGSSKVTLRDTVPVLLISYKPDSGAFLSLCKQIDVTNESRSSTIHMVNMTGNHYVD